MTNLDTILKSKDITLPTKVHIDKVMVFPVVMYWCERWTIKKAEHFRIDAFELWCWRRFLSPLDSKEVKPVSPKRHQPWIFIERTDAEALKYWPSDVRSQVIGKDSDPAKAWGQEEKELTEDRWLDGITKSMHISLSKLWEIVKDRKPGTVPGVGKDWTKVSN